PQCVLLRPTLALPSVQAVLPAVDDAFLARILGWPVKRVRLAKGKAQPFPSLRPVTAINLEGGPPFCPPHNSVDVPLNVPPEGPLAFRQRLVDSRPTDSTRNGAARCRVENTGCL